MIHLIGSSAPKIDQLVLAELAANNYSVNYVDASVDAYETNDTDVYVTSSTLIAANETASTSYKFVTLERYRRYIKLITPISVQYSHQAIEDDAKLKYKALFGADATIYDIDSEVRFEAVVNPLFAEQAGLDQPAEHCIMSASPKQFDSIVASYLANSWVARCHIFGNKLDIVCRLNLQHPKSIIYTIKELERIKQKHVD